MGLVIRLLVNAVALLIVASFVAGIHIDSFPAAILAAFVLGIVNAILRPILILISLPLEILSLGLFTLVINAALFLLVAHFHLGLHIDSFASAFVGAIVLSIVSFLLSMVFGAVERAV